MSLQASWFWLALLVFASVTQLASSQGATWLPLRNAHTIKHGGFLASCTLCICLFVPWHHIVHMCFFFLRGAHISRRTHVAQTVTSCTIHTYLASALA